MGFTHGYSYLSPSGIFFDTALYAKAIEAQARFNINFRGSIYFLLFKGMIECDIKTNKEQSSPQMKRRKRHTANKTKN